jgi:hypothetical protein
VQVAIEAASAGKAGARLVFSTKRACPNCGTGFPELDPRLFSFNSKHGWCKSCFGTGLALAGLRRRTERRGIAVARHGETGVTGLPGLRRRAAQSGRAPGAVSRPVDRRDHAPAGTRVCGGARANSSCGARARDRADLLAELGSRSRVPLRRRLGLFAARSRGADAVGRRGAAHPARGSARLQSAGVCYVLDEPTIGLHPRDNRALLDTLDRLRAQGQYAGRGRARRGHDSPRRSRDRSRVRAPANLRRRRGRAGHGRRTRPAGQFGPPGAASRRRSRIRTRAGAGRRATTPSIEIVGASCTTCATSTRASRSAA